MEQVKMRKLFKKNPHRFDEMSLFLNDILFDYSKNLVTDKTLELLFNLARQERLPERIEQMFSGDKINYTEKRAVLHTALRNRGSRPVMVDGEDVMPAVHHVLVKISGFVHKVHSGRHRGYTGKRITDIVNIGIGGSDLGPYMVTEALKPYAVEGINVHFVSNIDGVHVGDVIKRVDPERTLFVVASKTFTTQETLTNARTARRWLIEKLRTEEAVANHFVAVSTNEPAVRAFGIDPDNMFEFWDWVGGRYSLWSAIGLPIALYLGMGQFERLLEGAYIMDNHFRSAPLEQNMPVIMGLIGLWYSSFFRAKSYAILPYDQHLHRFTAYLQQAEMESNGKNIDRDGNPVQYCTAPVIWGESGTNGQHAFYQLMHQGTQVVPADLMMPLESQMPIGHHHQILMANCFAQSEAFMRGRTYEESLSELRAKGVEGEEAEKLAAQMVMPGNRPTNTILFHKLNPRTLGSLIALYEHKIFVQGSIWRINSFDQFGVELGKKLASAIMPELEDDRLVKGHDSSTNGLINYYKNNLPHGY
ncbi:MAG: glucose-6-phosphate isomerase [Gammaproteobacteria bacterium]|nr:glucose-6-phosphate isomerase [Gammaproteobacteria bacterium]